MIKIVMIRTALTVGGSAMSDLSASTELEPADSESSKGGARVVPVIVGVLIGMGIGLGIGMGIGNAARKRYDRYSPTY
jgi:hypothetical protein